MTEPEARADETTEHSEVHVTTLIEPLQRDGLLLADIASTANAADNSLRLWWLGQAGFLVQWRGRHLLLDPYLSDSLTTKYAGTDKPHVRMTARAVDPSQLRSIDVVSSSHSHTDHLDHDTIWPLLEASPDLTLVIPRRRCSNHSACCAAGSH